MLVFPPEFAAQHCILADVFVGIPIMLYCAICLIPIYVLSIINLSYNIEFIHVLVL